ncbi:MAG: YggS family pyridoxal phosphate-dependent enzyme [Candidatus Neomarinimicrobiota bacterium]
MAINTNLKKRLNKVTRKIKSAEKRSPFGNKVKIIAVTKTKPFKNIVEVYQLGITSIGENRVNDAIKKFESSLEKMPDVEKRFIGHLQSNKTKKCVNAFDTIDSIHSLKLLKKVSQECEKTRKKIEVLLEINTSGETQKKGFSVEDTNEILQCFEIQNVQVVGLMTMAPFTKDEKKIRTCFSLLRKMKNNLNNNLPLNPLKELSMGMSNDYEIAIEEGATQIRLGTILFGPRN